MFFRSGALLVATLASTVAATPLAHHRQNETTPTACAAVASLVKNATSAPTVPAALAWECIQSVPLNVSSALELIKTMKPYLDWQSSTSYIKDPPAEYAEKVQPAVDIFGGLDIIESQLKSGFFKTEFDFGMALYTLIQSTHDGHLAYIPDIVARIFTWGRPVPLVSVSEDGSKLPSLFVYSDILSASQNSGFSPSPLTKINGQDAIEFMLKWLEIGSLQDRDALWNNAFYNLAAVSLGPGGSGTGSFAGGGRGRFVYPGATTELTFANGSTVSYTNYARVRQNMAGIASGEDLAKKYFTYPNATYNPASPPPTEPSSPSGPEQTNIPAPGYPTPIIRDPQNAIGGYYLPEDEYSDVAVLGIASFEGYTAAGFQSLGQKFLADAKAAGKKKLVIDVSANGGGYILLGYDLFKQLFPSIDPFGAADRFRAHEAYDLIGQFASNISGFYPRDFSVEDEEIIDFISSPRNYRSDLDPATNGHFTSWPQKYGPEPHNGDAFTKKSKWWLSDPLIQWYSGGIDITGYASLANTTAQPFAAEDIIIVYDGYCASTCTIFSELMRRLAGVQTIAMGGRPNDDIIQAVGGTKGTNNYPWVYMQAMVKDLYHYTPKHQHAIYDHSAIGKYNSDLPFLRAASEPNVNARDGIRKNDDTNTPLQFVYEEADCRLYYTPEMTVDVTAIWKAAVDVKWGKKECVAGSLHGAKKEKRSVRPVSQTARVSALRGDVLSELKESLKVHTEMRTRPMADGIMLP